MKIRTLLTALLLASSLGAIAPVAAEEPPIYGSELMTPQERAEHRERIRNAKNAKERAQIRMEHHERMQHRAEQRGLKLPDEPPTQGRGKGLGNKGDKGASGKGQWQGQGSGQNKGQSNGQRNNIGGGMGGGKGR